jgi:drug/metabolite transporter (DMT)-like permease
VYPVARGGVFLFLPVLGFLVFGERLGVAGWVALSLIVVGIMLLPLARLDLASFRDLGRHLRERWMIFALLAAASTAAYTVWTSTRSVHRHVPLLCRLHGAARVWFTIVLARAKRGEVRAEWRKHRVAIAIAGVFIASSYLLLLVALRDGISSQVLAVRQLSIPIGVLLGWRFLRESLSVPRVIGSALITAGCALAALI